MSRMWTYVAILLVCLSGAEDFAHEVHSVSTLDVWNTGGIQMSILGKFSTDFDRYKYRVWFGEHEAPVMFGKSGEKELVVASPVIAKTVETSDYAVRVECTTEAGTTADLKWGPTAEPFYQMVRIHNYDSTVQQQTQLAQEAQQKQADLLSARLVSSFSDLVMVNSFYSKERDDHTLCGIGGDNFATCPSRGAGYQLLRNEGQCSRVRMANTTQLKFYYSKHTQDNAVAVKKSGAKVGKHSFVRVDCYVWTSDGNGTRVPLELYFNKERADHLATATAGGRVYALEHNYTLLGVQGYILPPPKDTGVGLSENSASVLKTLDNLIALHASHKATLKTKQEWVVPQSVPPNLQIGN